MVIRSVGNGGNCVYVLDTSDLAEMTLTVFPHPETDSRWQFIQIKLESLPDVIQLKVSLNEYLVWSYITTSQEEVRKLSDVLGKSVCCQKDGILHVEDEGVHRQENVEEYLRNSILSYISKEMQDIQLFYLPYNGADVNLQDLKKCLKGCHCYLKLNRECYYLHVAVQKRHETTCSNHITSYLISNKLNSPWTTNFDHPLCVGRMLTVEDAVQKCRTKFKDTSLTLGDCGDQTKITLTSSRQETFDEASKWLEQECHCGKINLNTKSFSMVSEKQILQKYLEAVVVDIQQNYGKHVKVFWDVCEVKQEKKVEVVFCNTICAAVDDTVYKALKSLNNQKLDNSIFKCMPSEKIRSFLTEEGKKSNIFLELAVEHDGVFVFYDKRQKLEVDKILSQLQEKLLQFPKMTTGQPQSFTSTNVESVVRDPLGAVGKAETKGGQIPYSAVQHKCWVTPNHHEIVVAQMKADRCEREILVVIAETNDLSKFIVLFSNNILALFLMYR